MIVPGLTRGSQRRVLDVLRRVTHLSEEAVTAAFMDADRGRATLLDPSVAHRQSAYRAAAYGLRHAEGPEPPTTGARVAEALAAQHHLSVSVAGIVLGAAVGMRLALEVRLSRTRITKKSRPKLATKVAKFGTKESDLDVAKRWAREMGRAARQPGRKR